jgi:hypothetical protein
LGLIEMTTVWFVDTSILCNLLRVPGRDQNRESVADDWKAKQDSGASFILPVTAVIETGNHISQLSDGRERRKIATTFHELLLLVAQNKAPWKLHTFSWDENFLGVLTAGAMTGVSMIEHASSGMGCGDLCLLAERVIYRERAGLPDVRVWTLDAKLHAHN